jgi:hypothetical protein
MIETVYLPYPLTCLVSPKGVVDVLGDCLYETYEHARILHERWVELLKNKGVSEVLKQSSQYDCKQSIRKIFKCKYKKISQIAVYLTEDPSIGISEQWLIVTGHFFRTRLVVDKEITLYYSINGQGVPGPEEYFKLMKTLFLPIPCDEIPKFPPPLLRT